MATSRFRVKADFVVYADSPREARGLIGACVELWEDEGGIDHVNGVGGAKGYVTTEELDA